MFNMLMKSQKSFFNIKTLRFKIFICNLVIVIIAFLLLVILFVRNVYDIAYEEALELSNSSLIRISTFMDEKSASIRLTADTFALNPDITALLLKDNAARYEEPLLWNIDYTTINEIISQNIYYSDINRIYILTDNAIASSYVSPLFIPLSQMEGSLWYEHVVTAKESFFWDVPDDFFPDEIPDENILFSRKLPYNYHTYDTYYVGSIHKDTFLHLVSADSNTPYTACFLINGQNNIIVESSSFDTVTILSWINSSNFESGQRNIDTLTSLPTKLFTIENHSYLLGLKKIPQTDLTLVFAYDYDQRTQNIVRDNLNNIIIIMLFILPLVLGSSFFISVLLTKRLDLLKANMLKVSEGDFKWEVLASNEEDEISILNKHFNYMATKIAFLLDKQYGDGQRIKELELFSLQAQINPHFLYNTLDLIKWKAVKTKETQIEDLVNTLSDYYRIGLSKGDALVTLSSELAHITAYVHIQNQRFENSIHLNIGVDKKFLDYKLPKLTLQPIVENSILHGILEKESGAGIIYISIEEAKSSIYLHIRDDGIGIDAVTINSLLLKDDQDHKKKGGYGLHNINERIRLTFGENYGIKIESTPDSGTAVSICMPSARVYLERR